MGRTLSPAAAVLLLSLAAMTYNLSHPDRKVRLVIAGLAAVLIVFGLIEGVTAWIVGAVALVLAATSLFGFCPLYRAIGFSSLPRRRT